MQVLEARLSWGGTVVAVERLAQGADLVVGEADDAVFQLALPSLPGPRHALARVAAGEAFVDLPPGFVAFVDGEERAAPFVLAPGARARVPLGALEVELSFKAQEPRVAVPLARALDLVYTKVLTTLLVFEAAVVAALMLTPRLGLDDAELFTNRPVFHAIQERTPKTSPAVRTTSEAPRTRPPALAARAAPAPRGARSRPGSARAAAEDALAALGLSSLSGASLGGGLIDGARALSGLKGPAPGGAGGDGHGGLASRGLPGGGGGGVLGIGGLGGAGGGAGPGGAGVDLCGPGGCRNKRHALVDERPPVTKGGLDREEIQRVMRRALKQVQFCYERGLQRAPELEGKIAVSFVIAKSGDVALAQAATSSLDDAEVDACVLRVVKRLQFPAPRGGGEVVVTYPFVFSSAGAR